MAKYKFGDMRTVQHTAGSAISADDVVVLGGVDGKKVSVGVAMEDIANGAVGAVAVSGVFEFAKVSAAVITAGAGDVGEFGKAMESKGNGDTTVLVEISEPGTYDAA